MDMNLKIWSKLFLVFTVLLVWACKDNGPDDPQPELPKLNVSNVTIFEGDGSTTFNFKVALSAVSETAVTADFITEEITAGENSDFIPQSGTLSIAPGEQEYTIAIEIVTDTIQEPDEEFKVIISNATNATILNSEGLGTIRNDDNYVFIPADGYITPLSYTGYDLVWQDEFDGTELNLNDWTHEQGAGGWGNNELQHYTNRTDNSRVQSGNLIIEAKQESFNGSNYTSARIITRGKQSFTWGRVDIRAILPEGQGIWPALWMLGESFSTVGWPACGEIDIMELVGHQPSTVHGTAHWGPQGQSFSINDGEHIDLNGEKFSDKYHVFSIIWEPGKITWYMDDQQFFQIENSDIDETYRFDDEFFFIFNIAVGGNWPGNPNASTQFPQQMIVDYIRVFQ